MIQRAGQEGLTAAQEIIVAVSKNTVPKMLTDPSFIRPIWQSYAAISEKYNEPGRFTAFAGYEWTSNNKGNNLHRMVIFRDDKSTTDEICDAGNLTLSAKKRPRNAPVRVCPRSPEDWSQARAEAGCESVQVRDDWQHRLLRLPRDRRRGQFLWQAFRKEPSSHRWENPSPPSTGSVSSGGSRRHRATPRCGPPRTPERPSSTP
jgi:Protein of unknown function (DUF3604)